MEHDSQGCSGCPNPPASCVTPTVPQPSAQSGPELYRAVAELTSDGILIIRPPARITYANRAAGAIHGSPANDLVGRDVRELIDLADRKRVTGFLRRLAAAAQAKDASAETAVSAGPPSGLPSLRNYKILRADGRVIACEVSAKAAVCGGGPVIVVVLRDLSTHEQLQRQLNAMTAEYDMIFGMTGGGLALLDVDDEGQLVFRRVNATVERATGIAGDLVRGLTLKQVFGEQAEQIDKPYKECLSTAQPVSFDLDIEPGAGGPLRVWHVTLTPIVDAHGTVRHIVVSAHDITERKQMEHEIRQLSFYDKLTNLYNRRYFEQELHRLEGSREYPITVICSDIDGLKLINDTMGHRQGDRLLRAYARLLNKVFRKSDVVARVGGDEFAVALTRTTAAVAEDRCRALEAMVSKYNLTHPKLPLSVSFGLATSEDRQQSLEEAFIQADKNMYQDKVHRTAAAAHSIVRALVTALAQRDHQQAGRIGEVTALSRALGQSLALGKKDMADLLLLSEMHNLGTVGIPDKILHKRGRLTRAEREVVQQHAMMGYRIARSSPELSHIADLILHHHEWYNGEGYPMGLQGEEIPLPCRIINIVDAYTAMTNDRPYREAMSQERAVQELRFYSGLQFDADLVERFIAVCVDNPVDGVPQASGLTTADESPAPCS
jgi:diguanylate cyclase (GGDEF)-like protein/PAS domain S-box-containing protein